MARMSLLILALLVARGSVALAAGTNIALHRPYTFSIPPSLSADPGDQTELTDGQLVPAKSIMYAQKQCVGWASPTQPVSITIDLGKDQPISGASFSTAAAGVNAYPISLAISVSEDGRTFHTVGDLARLDEADTPSWGVSYSTHTYSTNGLRTHGRFFRLTGIAPGMAFFSDEIQVFLGEESFLNDPVGGEILTDAQLADPLRLTRLGVHRRLNRDWAAVRSAVEKEAPGQARSGLLEKLDALKPLLQKEEHPKSMEGFKAILPVGDLDARIFSVYGELMAAGGVAPLTLWHTPRYQLVEVFEKPSGSLNELTVRMMGNETRAQTFNLTNASDRAKQVRFTLEGLPDKAVEVSEVEIVDTRLGWPAALALVPLKGKSGQYVTTVPAGLTRQIWLSFHSKDIPAGEYAGQIKLSADSFDQTVPLRLSVANIRMADTMALNTDSWDYIYNTGFGLSAGNREAAARDLLDHRINVVWALVQTTPVPRAGDFDAQGNLTGRIDYSKWDAFVNYWRDRGEPISRYAVAHGPIADFCGFRPNSPEFNNAVSQWAADWAKHNREIGLKPGQAMILFRDEPNASHFQECYDLFQAFRSRTREIAIFVDPIIHGEKEMQAAMPMLKLADVVMPTLDAYRGLNSYPDLPSVRAMYQQLVSEGAQLGFYQCSPIAHFDPSYWRLQPWWCFAANAASSSWWAYCDSRLADSWNPYTSIGQADFSPVYLSPNSVSSSKYWEAAREGIEDYQYLYMLEQRDGSAAVRPIVQKMLERLDQKDRYYAIHPSINVSQYAERQRLDILQQLVSGP